MRGWLGAAVPAVPQTIGPYRIDGELGRGGMGIVYSGTGADGQPAAIKVLSANLPEHESKRFDREAQVDLRHPNITSVLDTGRTDDGGRYIAFERLEGHDLSQEIGGEPVAFDAVLDIGKQACAGLAAAHAAGLVHRDIKPSNLFRCTDGTIKILDFGVARWVDDDARLTTTGLVIGTPAFLSPEQARGDDDVDYRADIFSLGVMLYQALTGTLPFARKNRLGTLVAVIMQPVPPVRQLRGDTPPALAAAVERALEKRRDARWADAAAMGRALAGLETSSPSTEVASAWLRADERRVVAVLLADDLKAPAVFRAAVEERGGQVLPLLGQRAVGLFGADAWAGDEIVRACDAGLVARSAAANLAVASGWAFDKDGQIFGDALAAAERGCAAGLRGLAVDGDAAPALGEATGLIGVRDGLFQLSDAGGLRARGRRVTVGRTAELAQMEGALRQVVDTEGAALIVITGPAGIGKSHLVRLLVERISGELTTLTAGARPHRRGEPLALITSALREFLDEQAANVTQRQQMVLRWLETSVSSDAEVIASGDLLAELLGLPIADPGAVKAVHDDPQLLADRRRLALVDALVGLAADGPLGLVLEDLHWADSGSVAVIEELLEILRDDPLLVAVTAREPRDAARLLEDPRATRVSPTGLSRLEVQALAAAVAGQPVDGPLAQRLHERTGGNPLFVEHIVAAMGDSSQELPLPPTVEAAVQSRLDQLPPAPRSACLAAAVFARPITSVELAALDIADADLSLAELTKQGLLTARRQRRGDQARRFRFASALVEHVAYRMLGDAKRGALHGKAARYLDTAGDADDEEVAVHLEGAGDLGQAGLRYEAAALVANGRGDSHAVLRCADRAAAARPSAAAPFAVHAARAEAYGFLGQRGEEEAALADAAAAATCDAERATALSGAVGWLSRAGRSAEALNIAAEAVAAARAGGDHYALAMARGRQGVAATYAGDLELAARALDEAAALARSGSAHTRGLVAAWRAQLATASGDLGARKEAFAEALALYRQAHDLRRAAGAATNLADAFNRFGAYAEAEPALRQALADCRRVGNRPMEGYALVNLGYALAGLGRTADADDAFASAHAVAEALCQPRLSVVAQIYRTRLQIEADPTTAAETLTALAQRAQETQLGGLQVSALTAAARALMLAGEVAQAVATAERALEIRDALGGVEEDEAELYRTYGDALEAAGKPGDAAAIRAIGKTRIEAIATGIADPAWRRRFCTDVPANAALGVLGARARARSAGGRRPECPTRS